MKRRIGALAVALVAFSCSTHSPSLDCARVPDFLLTLESKTGDLPMDTLVEVSFGGGSKETYSPNSTPDPRVLFCTPTLALMEGAGGGGAVAEGGTSSLLPDGGPEIGGQNGVATGNTISSIVCELWTDGPATVRVATADFEITKDLEPKPRECTQSATITVGDGSEKP